MDDKLVPAEEAAKILEEKEKQNPENFQENKKPLPTVEELHDQRIKERVKDGKLVEKPSGTSSIHGAADSTWKNLPLDLLPTQGMFYPDDAQITIRAAMSEEIRHWSTMDEYDAISINDRMNMIIEKCVRLQDSKRITHDWREIKEIDRLFLIVRVYELTFPNKENVLYMKFGCNLQCKGDGEYKEDVPLNSGMLNMFSIPDEVMQYFDSTRKCFVAHSEKLNKDIRFYMPSIGVSQYVKNLINDARINNKHIDTSFAKIAPYLFKDTASIQKEGEYEKMRQSSFTWDKNELLFVNGVADRLESAINLNIKKECPRCGIMLEMPLFFRGGFTIKSFFAVSTGFNDLI